MIAGGSAFLEGGHGAEDLAACLNSVRPVRFDQIVISENGINEAVKVSIADESALRQKDGLSSIEVPHFDWCDDFAAARNHSLSFVRTDWWFWCDADDVMENPELLRSLIEDVGPNEDIGGVWLPYRYSFDQYGNCTTLQDRERLMRMSVGWTWRRRVHEVPQPLRHVQWWQDDRVVLNHRRGHEQHAGRNLRMLLLMLKDDSDDIRVWRDLGNQYFAGGEWDKAVEWYEKFAADTRPILMERWQALCYAARAYREARQLAKALRADNKAILMIPQWDDPYFGLGQTYALMEDWDKSIFWAEQSRTKEIPPRLLFVNPLESQVKAAEIIAFSAYQAGDFDKAIENCKDFLALRPQEQRMLDHLELCKKAQGTANIVNSFVEAGKLLTDREKIELATRFPDIRQSPRVREVVIPALMRFTKRGTQPEVEFFCGDSLDAWYPGLPETKGIGASEVACIEIAQRFAKTGWRSIVFNRCDSQEGRYDDVIYADFRRWRAEDKSDLLVSWRYPALGTDKFMGAKERWLWMHNVYAQGMTETAVPGFTKILGVSPSHVQAMRDAYPFLKDAPMDYVPNGVQLERFQKQVERKPHKVVYTSSPDRGLVHLLAMWPQVVEHIPDAELHVFYGLDNMEKMIRMGHTGLQKTYDDVVRLAQQPGVRWRGRVNQAVLAEELLSSQMWAYPCTWTEEFCVAALEAMAAGLYILTSDMGALPWVLGEVGDKVPITKFQTPEKKKWQKEFLGLMFLGLLSPDDRERWREAGPARAAQFTWDNAFGKWMTLLGMDVSRNGHIPFEERRGWLRGQAVGKVLDVGCASGYNFKGTPFDVTYTDINTFEMPNFVQADAHNLPFSDGEFDTVVLGEVLEHVKKPARVLTEASRVARQRVVITVPDEHHWSEEYCPFMSLAERMSLPEGDPKLRGMDSAIGMTREQLYMRDNPGCVKVNDTYGAEHHTFFTEQTFKELLARNGIEYHMEHRVFDARTYWVATLEKKEEPVHAAQNGGSLQEQSRP